MNNNEELNKYYIEYVKEYNNYKTNKTYNQWLKEKKKDEIIIEEEENNNKENIINNILNSKNKKEYIKNIKKLMVFYQDLQNEEDVNILMS